MTLLLLYWPLIPQHAVFRSSFIDQVLDLCLNEGIKKNNFWEGLLVRQKSQKNGYK